MSTQPQQPQPWPLGPGSGWPKPQTHAQEVTR